jgi:hypothetical protein
MAHQALQNQRRPEEHIEVTFDDREADDDQPARNPPTPRTPDEVAPPAEVVAPAEVSVPEPRSEAGSASDGAK